MRMRTHSPFARISRIALVMTLILGAGGAVAQEAHPETARRPVFNTGDYYPQRAADEGIGGRVVLTCTVSADGSLRDCVVDSESPTGHGFGSAALRAAQKLRMRTTTVDGAPTEGATVHIPLTFNPPD
jgi:protein TonB